MYVYRVMCVLLEDMFTLRLRRITIKLKNEYTCMLSVEQENGSKKLILYGRHFFLETLIKYSRSFDGQSHKF